MSDSDLDNTGEPSFHRPPRTENQNQNQNQNNNNNNNNTIPWVEKYRPRTLNDVQSQEEAVSALRKTISGGGLNFPNLLVAGPQGTGKTSSVLACAHELFGPDYMKARVKELNASDERGIQVVREKVKLFAQGAVGHLQQQKTQRDGKIYPVPPFKLIILDEADALLPDAQAALRRMMEDFSDVTRFCILCNYVSRIIDPISSRCAKFRFKPLTDEVLYSRMRFIAEKEGLLVSDQCLKHLDKAAAGDMRLAIMHLQSAARAHGQDLRNEDFVFVSGRVPEKKLRPYLELLCAEKGGFDPLYQATNALVKEGYSAGTILEQIHDFVVSDECKFSDVRKSLLILHMSKLEYRVLNKGDDFIQLASLAGKFFETRGK